MTSCRVAKCSRNITQMSRRIAFAVGCQAQALGHIQQQLGALSRLHAEMCRAVLRADSRIHWFHQGYDRWR